MRRNALLILMTMLGAMLCWWALIQNPGALLPLWFIFVPIALVALGTGLATILANRVWPCFFAGSAAGTLGGLYTGAMIWPIKDSEAAGIFAFFILPIAVVTALLSVGAELVGRRMSVTNPRTRRAIWVAFIGYCALGPAVLLLTPPLFPILLAHNDHIATKRFDGLKSAVARTVAEDSSFLQTCNGRALSSRYSGPRISRSDWDHIAGKDGIQPRGAAVEGGYNYLVACYENGAYTITAKPVLERSAGTLIFCADQTGTPKCGIRWESHRFECMPCSN